MSLLAAAPYDPAVAVEKVTTANTKMAAFDTTNLRVKFVVPPNGAVLVRVKAQAHGATSLPRVLLGIMEGATVKGRMAPVGSIQGIAATSQMPQEVIFVVEGLTPGAELTWDAAYGVELSVAATGLKYGGPNDASGNDAWGPTSLEVWEAPTLLKGKLYDPAASVTKSVASLLAMTALDTTNLRFTFKVPASGKVLWRVKAQFHGATTFPTLLLGILEGATVVGRTSPLVGNPLGQSASATVGLDGTGIVTGLTPGAELTWDASYAVQVVQSEGGLKYGGGDNTTQNDAFGGIAYELWAA
jgi:hypothetical protein